MLNSYLVGIGIVVFLFFLRFLVNLKKEKTLVTIDNLYVDNKKESVKLTKLNYCNTCKFSKLYPSNKIFCKNETVLNKVYDFAFVENDDIKFTESEKSDTQSILVHGDVDCSISRKVMGRNCSCYVLKETIGFTREEE